MGEGKKINKYILTKKKMNTFMISKMSKGSLLFDSEVIEHN